VRCDREKLAAASPLERFNNAAGGRQAPCNGSHMARCSRSARAARQRWVPKTRTRGQRAWVGPDCMTTPPAHVGVSCKGSKTPVERLLLADTVAKVENRTTLKISRKLILDFSTAASLFSAATKIRGRFWTNRYGPSRRRAQNASAALKNFVCHPKKTFSTLSAPNGHRKISPSTCSLRGRPRKVRPAAF
jgi:hypothetical protein